ncbi:type II toxin-antitoxin system RelB/DinJ family antitoxin [Candidatus Kaiserbacteria bacterium]|nr:type II toxin-antitoxin system RelB/DinJ family antitoxin [Candidatus Kaiserbacteria bacterium]
MADMAKTAYVNTRVEKKLKADAEKVLEQIGVSTSDLMTMTLKQVVIQQGLPFDVCTRSHVPNKETRKTIRALEAGEGEVFTGPTKELFDMLEGRKSRKA